MSRKIIIALKVCAFICYSAFLLLGNLLTLSSLSNMNSSLSMDYIIGIKYIIILFFVLIWLLLTYMLITNYFQKYIIQNKLNKSKFNNIFIKKYKYSKGNHLIMLKFLSAGLPLQEWQKQKSIISSIINYNIFDIQQSKRMDTFIVMASIGYLKENDEILYDE